MKSPALRYFIRKVRQLICGLIVLLSVALLVACDPTGVPGSYSQSTLSALSIAATGAAAATQASNSMATNASAGTLVAAVTMNAADAQAIATVSRAATLDALSLTPAASTAVALQATNDTIHAQSTLDAVNAQTQQAQDGAYMQATADSLRILSTEEVKRQQNATNAAAMWAYVPTCFAILLLIGAVVVLLAVVHLLEDKKSRHRVESMLHTTPAGTFLVIWDDDAKTVTSRPIDALPGAPVLRQIAGPVSSAAPTIYRAGHTVQVWPPTWSAEQDAANERARRTLADVLALLDDAIAVSDRAATIIPRYDKLPNWRTRPLDWKRITDWLVTCGYAIKRQGPPIVGSDTGGGTYLTRGYTLYTLSDALRKGQLKMRILAQNG